MSVPMATPVMPRNGTRIIDVIILIPASRKAAFLKSLNFPAPYASLRAGSRKQHISSADRRMMPNIGS